MSVRSLSMRVMIASALVGLPVLGQAQDLGPIIDPGMVSMGVANAEIGRQYGGQIGGVIAAQGLR